MNYKLYIFFLFVLANNIFSQDKCEIFLNDIKDFLVTGKDIVSAPFHFQQDDWIKFGSLSAATTLAYLADEDIRDFSAGNHGKFNDALFSLDNNYYAITLGVAGVGLYGYGLFGNEPELRKLALQLGEAAAYTTLIVSVIKIAAGRNRPYLNNGKDKFDPGSLEFTKNSFPSSHTAFYFAVSTVMANYIDNIYWDIGWYSLAAIVAASRVYNDWHWFSDVVFGGVSGYFIGEFVVNNKNDNKEIGKLKILPGVNYFNQSPVYTVNFEFKF